MIAAGFAVAAALAAAGTLLPGTYTNEEQVYFATEAGRPAPPWTGVAISNDGGAMHMRSIDAFGKMGPDDMVMTLAVDGTDGSGVAITSGGCSRRYGLKNGQLSVTTQTGTCNGPAVTGIAATGLTMMMPDGTALNLQRARRFKCWASIPRLALKDGKQDWWFQSGLILHDRGGRVLATTDEPVPQTFTLRMRNVVWPAGGPAAGNAPSLVLYVHGADPGHAIAYSWADPAAVRVGINLRNVQASCALAG